MFGRKTPQEIAEADHLAAHREQMTLLEQILKSKAVDVKATADRIQGDRLKRDRRAARLATAKVEHQHHIDIRSKALAEHNASDNSDEPFDPTVYDSMISRWAAEIESRTEMLTREEGTLAEALALHAAALLEERRARHRLRVCELTEMIRVLRQKALEVIGLEGQGVSSVVQELGLQQILANTAGTERLVETYLRPPARKEIDFLGAVVFVKSTTGIAGNLDGRLYGPEDGPVFDHPTAARLVAAGSARWLKETPENLAAAERGRKQLAAIDHSAGSARVDVGWQQVVNE